VLEALVARKKISRNDAGQYGRAVSEGRRRPNQDLFG
jgi:magnesium chelatase subunit I